MHVTGIADLTKDRALCQRELHVRLPALLSDILEGETISGECEGATSGQSSHGDMVLSESAHSEVHALRAGFSMWAF